MGLWRDLAKHLVSGFNEFFFFLFALLDALVADLFEFGRTFFVFADHLDQVVREIFHVDLAHVEDDEFGADAFGGFERLHGVLEGVFAFFPIERREFEDVGRGVVHAHGERAEVVQRGNFNLFGVHCFKDTGEEGNSYAVAEFGVFEAKVADFAEHRAAVGVAVRVPTG